MITIVGEVSAPGVYKFFPNERLKAALKRGGGFTQNAEKNDIFITYPNGASKKLGRFSNPKVLDGSVITIGTKKEEEPFNKTEYAKELTSILASLAGSSNTISGR